MLRMMGKQKHAPARVGAVDVGNAVTAELGAPELGAPELGGTEVGTTVAGVIRAPTCDVDAVVSIVGALEGSLGAGAARGASVVPDGVSGLGLASEPSADRKAYAT